MCDQRAIQTMQLCSVKHCSQTLPLDDILRATGGVLPALANLHCWKVETLAISETAWSSALWGHCPLFHGANLHRLDRPQ